MLITFSLSALASKIYTPEQLNSMVNSGNYPSQDLVKSQTKTASFAECRLSVESVLSAIRDNYPTKILIDTAVLYTEKAWTNNAAMTVSCSKLDNKMVITQANYL